MIRINRIIPQTVLLYSPSGDFLGNVNEYEFNDVRQQICKGRLKGYYVMYGGKKKEINEHGVIDKWEGGFFGLIEKQLSEILTTSMTRRRENKL